MHRQLMRRVALLLAALAFAAPSFALAQGGSHGYTHVPVFLADAACGLFEVVVTGGGRKIVKQIEATCGE